MSLQVIYYMVTMQKFYEITDYYLFTFVITKQRILKYEKKNLPIGYNNSMKYNQILITCKSENKHYNRYTSYK